MELFIKILVGIAGSFLTFYIINHGVVSAQSSDTKGKLYFGNIILYLTLVCSIISIFMMWVLFYTDHNGQETPILFLIGMFGLLSIYLWLEYIFTRGYFDDEGIKFRSFWGGRRYYPWQRMQAATFNSTAGWYILSFDDGQKIRISAYLHGQTQLKVKLSELGINF